MEPDMTTSERIAAEKQQLLTQLVDLGPDTLTTVDKLVDRVAFMTVTLEDLEADVVKNGFKSEYQNGANQWGEKKSAAAELHLSMMQRYLPAMKQLLDLLPADDGQKHTDPVRDFVKRR
jgi:hypothetical protein